jgi:hypothetical protein
MKLSFSFSGKCMTYLLMVAGLMAMTGPAIAQHGEDSVFKPSGKIWGLVYGDFAFKSKGDTLNRGFTNQYTGVKEGQNLFQFRRIYLGYDYQISKKFSSEFLLAAEDYLQTSTTATPVVSGDLLANNKLSLFVKLANVKWKNILPNTDVSVGEMYTPAAVLLAEELWDYRCIERTVSDLRRTPTWDMGVMVTGRLVNTNHTEAGYHVMVGNGTASRPENDAFKTIYGDVYAKLLDKKLVFDLYADYTKLNWTPVWHHDRCMVKGIVAYTTPKFTVGVEGFLNTVNNDNIATESAGPADTIKTQAVAFSVFARGRLYKDLLGFFVRYDSYDPTGNNNNGKYAKYAPRTKNYDPNTKEQFFTAGIDYSPISKIHIMPNVWYTGYSNAGPLSNYNAYDLVFRLSLYYVYGK